MAAPNLTAHRLRELLDYDPKTGVFRRKIRSGKAQPGTIAGSIQCHGYVLVSIGGDRYLAHRLAWLYMNGSWPEKWIDHINGNPSDNRIANLREATPAQNGWNKIIQSHNTSGVKGVHWCPERGQWRAYIYANHKRIHLGRFATLKEAKDARDFAERKIHNEYRLINRG